MLTPLKESYDQPIEYTQKQRHYFANKGPSSQSYGFSSSHVWMWTGTTQRDGTGREEGGGFRMGNMCIPVENSCWYMQNQYNIVKLKNKVKSKKRKKNLKKIIIIIKEKEKYLILLIFFSLTLETLPNVGQRGRIRWRPRWKAIGHATFNCHVTMEMEGLETMIIQKVNLIEFND